MVQIFNFFGSLLGYLLWFLYNIFRNYGVAIVFFTLITRALMFPLNLKSQKSMAAQSRLTAKQAELQKIYGNDRQKYNEELAKLYQKEGVNPGGGCLMTLLPFPIMLGIYYSVTLPLSNTLHIASDRIAQATDFVSKMPGLAASANTGTYIEMQIVQNFSQLKEYMTMFTPEDVAKIEFFQKGFHFLGLDLLATPNASPFSSMMWLIPVLALLSYWAQSFIMTKMNPVQNGGGQGCMKVMQYGMPLLSAYWAFIMPGAVGFYWTVSALVGIVQSVVQNKMFSPQKLSAQSEGSRYATLLLADEKVRPLPADLQKQIADKIESKNEARRAREAGQKQAAKKTGPKKGGGKNRGSASDYMGAGK